MSFFMSCTFYVLIHIVCLYYITKSARVDICGHVHVYIKITDKYCGCIYWTQILNKTLKYGKNVSIFEAGSLLIAAIRNVPLSEDTLDSKISKLENELTDNNVTLNDSRAMIARPPPQPAIQFPTLMP